MCIYVFTSVCIYLSIMYVCTVCMYVCMYVYSSTLCMCMYVCLVVRIYMYCMVVCVKYCYCAIYRRLHTYIYL